MRPVRLRRVLLFPVALIGGLQIEGVLRDFRSTWPSLNRNCSGCSVLFELYRATVTCTQKKLELCHPTRLLTQIEKCL